jgi:hypothetical protein
VDNAHTDTSSCGSPSLPQPQPMEGTSSVRLSERDEAAILAAAQYPPAPNEAALQAARRFLQHR